MKQLRVLIVGRHAEVMERIRPSLRALPIQVEDALTDDQAAELIERNRYDVVSIGGGVDGTSRTRLKQLLAAQTPDVQLIEVPRPDADVTPGLTRPVIPMSGPDELPGILAGLAAAPGMSNPSTSETVTVQHDLHIHTFLSKCCKTPWSSFPGNIVARAAEAGLRTIGLADHLWDAAVAGATSWYAAQNFPYVNQARRLLPPDLRGVRVLFGCETEMRGDGTACLTPEIAERLDFVLMPHSHLHIQGIMPTDCRSPRQIADFMAQRFLRSLDFGFVTGIPHAFVPGRHEHEADEVVACLSDGQLQDCFGKAQERHVAIEITPNFFPSLNPEGPHQYHDETYLRVLRDAKSAGCLFYLGSDAHSLERVGTSKALLPFLIQLGITADGFHPLVR